MANQNETEAKRPRWDDLERVCVSCAATYRMRPKSGSAGTLPGCCDVCGKDASTTDRSTWGTLAAMDVALFAPRDYEPMEGEAILPCLDEFSRQHPECDWELTAVPGSCCLKLSVRGTVMDTQYFSMAEHGGVEGIERCIIATLANWSAAQTNAEGCTNESQ